MPDCVTECVTERSDLPDRIRKRQEDNTTRENVKLNVKHNDKM